MKRLVLAVPLAVAFCFAANGAFALTCEVQATEKKLAGAAKTSFMKKCVSESPVESCELQATEKKLAGAAKTSFSKKCVTDAATAKCEAEAKEKKLAGAAQASFTKKCIADNGGA
jgi:hypothetical protein